MLINWLLMHGNYNKWKGNKSGTSKWEIQKGIAELHKRKGAKWVINAAKLLTKGVQKYHGWNRSIVKQCNGSKIWVKGSV